MKKVPGAAMRRVQSILRVFLICVCVGTASGLFVPVAWGRYQAAEGSAAAERAPLPEQIEALNGEISTLRSEIQALVNMMQALERRMTTLEQDLSALRVGGGSSPGVAPAGNDPFTTSPGGVDPGRDVFADLGFPADEPLSSPEAAYLEASRRYQDAFQEFSYETPRDKINYLRRVRQWMGRTDRALTGKISWVCILQNIEILETGAALITVQVVNPSDSAEAWSYPRVLEVSRRVASGLKRQRPTMSGDLGFVKVTGIFRVKQEMDDNRLTQAIFEEPYLVGPFVIFNYEIEVNSVTGVQIKSPAPPKGG